MSTVKKVLIYRLPETAKEGILLRQYLLSNGITPVTVSGIDTGKTVGTLLGLSKGHSKGLQPMPKAPVLVLYNLPEPELDSLLEFLRSYCPVQLKAVATPYNVRWTFADLASQLEQEAGATGKKQQAGSGR